jgi:transketolase
LSLQTGEGLRQGAQVPVHVDGVRARKPFLGLDEDVDFHAPAGLCESFASAISDPGLLVFRPSDADEGAETWRVVTALRHEPAAPILSRQALPTLDRTKFAPASGLTRGGYVLADGRRPSRPTWCRDGGTPDVILLATDSEVHLALAAREQLQTDDISARVVNMPCWELFDRQPQQYRDEVLPPSVTARVAVTRASTLGWDRFVGDDGAVVGIPTFGASEPLKQLRGQFGFIPDRVAQVARDRLAALRRRYPTTPLRSGPRPTPTH